ncbi:MAG TPA: translation initiation factor IF-2 [Bacilli bacterium]
MSKQDNKDKLRVYEYAKSLNMSSKEIITILKRQNISVNNHMSVMEPEMISAVEKFFVDVKTNAAAKRAAQESASKAAQSAAKREGQQQQASHGQHTPARHRDDNREQRRNAGNRRNRPTKTAATITPASAAPAQPAPETQTTQPASKNAHVQEKPGAAASEASKEQRNNQIANRKDRTSGFRPRPDGQRQHQSDDAYRHKDHGQTDQRSQRGNFGRRHGGKSQDRPGQHLAIPPAPVTGKADGRQKQAAGGKPQAGQKAFAGADFAGKAKNNRKAKAADKWYEDGKGGASKANRQFGKGKNKGNDKQQRDKVDTAPKKIIVRGTMTVGELASALHREASEIIKKLLFLGVMATINQEIDLDTIQLIADEFNVEVEIKLPVEEDNFETVEETDDPADLEERPPVVTIMGHVDHGKTTLLDAIRHTRVTEGEAGGITQHIGAYQVEINGKRITFLDTPGHEAFTTMRARGAQVTDITVLVVAADDGVMPQTVEAINHAKAANVPIIVAVNKIDKPGANPDRIKQELTEHGLVPEEWGGDTIFVNISAKQKIGLDSLLEMILLVAEVQEFKANPNKRARGTVIEAELDKGRGPVARVLVQHGTLKIGDAFVAGVCFGRVRAMVNDKGRRVKEAGPSMPVELTGLTEVPQAGDPFMVFEDERKARAIAERRASKHRLSELRSNKRVTLDDLYTHIKEGEMKELNIIIKADVQGSAEALKGSLEKINVEGVRVNIIHSGVGAITESDIILASASNAIIIGFNVRPEPAAKVTAEHEHVDIRLHRIIYNVIDEIESAMKGMLDPEYKENIIGHAEVRNVFKISRIGTIAGCMVTSGKITRNAEARLIRDGVVIYEGNVESLKRFKDDAREVAQGYECGISLTDYNDIKEGDIIEAFVMETVER